MLALLFEVTPKPDGTQRYLDIAGRLKPALEKHDGFLFIDRYRSLSRPDTILSHSLWRDEAALAAWRAFEPHHHAQLAGREKVFADYRLRIADVVCSRTPGKADWRPERLSSYNEPAARAMPRRPTRSRAWLRRASSFASTTPTIEKPRYPWPTRSRPPVPKPLIPGSLPCAFARSSGTTACTNGGRPPNTIRRCCAH